MKEDEGELYYSDYAPEAAALMEVEEMEPEEKKGPTLGQVLGALIMRQPDDFEIDMSKLYCDIEQVHLLEVDAIFI